MKPHFSSALIPTLALLLGGGLAACSDSNKTTGQKLDAVVTSSAQKTAEVRADIKQGAADVKDAAMRAATATKQVISDATITTIVNAQLAKDTQLSALKIDVNTREGHVALDGTAPNATAKARATELASAVEGVLSVDNRLAIR